MLLCLLPIPRRKEKKIPLRRERKEFTPPGDPESYLRGSLHELEKSGACEENEQEIVDIMTDEHLDCTIVQSGKLYREGNIKGAASGLAILNTQLSIKQLGRCRDLVVASL